MNRQRGGGEREPTRHPEKDDDGGDGPDRRPNRAMNATTYRNASLRGRICHGKKVSDLVLVRSRRADVAAITAYSPLTRGGQRKSAKLKDLNRA